MPLKKSIKIEKFFFCNKYFKIYLFGCVWSFWYSMWTPVVAHGLSCFLTCRTLAPWPRIEPESPALQEGLFLPLGYQASPRNSFYSGLILCNCPPTFQLPCRSTNVINAIGKPTDSQSVVMSTWSWVNQVPGLVGKTWNTLETLPRKGPLYRCSSHLIPSIWACHQDAR